MNQMAFWGPWQLFDVDLLYEQYWTIHERYTFRTNLHNKHYYANL